MATVHAVKHYPFDEYKIANPITRFASIAAPLSWLLLMTVT